MGVSKVAEILKTAGIVPYYYDAKGDIAVVCGDCRELLPNLPDGCVDLVLTDPKYGISQPGVAHDGPPGKGTRSFDFFKNDSPEEANALALAARKETVRISTASGSAYWWVGHYTFGPLVQAYHDAGWKTRFLVWSKECPAPAPPGSGWPSAAELCVYAFRPGRVWTHNGKDAPRSNVLVADSYRHGMPGKLPHPTQKPFDVFKPLIVASSQPGDVVLDPFAGSGTTGRACKDLGRSCLMIELEERYCEIAANRLQQQVLFT